VTDLAAPDARNAGEEVIALALALQEASAIEFRASPKPKVWESDKTSGGGDGRPGNPTLEIAADARRLAVRAAVMAAHREVRAARLRLEKATAAWHGEARLDGGEAKTS
jgi:hypothetical protein